MFYFAEYWGTVFGISPYYNCVPEVLKMYQMSAQGVQVYGVGLQQGLQVWGVAQETSADFS